MRKGSLCTGFLVFSPILPALGIAGRNFYIFDFFMPFILLLFVMGKIRLKFETIQFSVFIACLSLLVAVLQLVMWGAPHSFSVVRFCAIALLIFLFKDMFHFINFERLVVRFVVVIACLGIFQFVDGFLLGGLVGVNDLVAMLYPYSGELSDNELAKAGGNQLKSGAFYRATSIGDGHPIIFGDLVACLAVLLLFWKRYLAYGIAAVAVFLTFSRGSWLMLAIGLVIYFVMDFRRLGFKFYLSVLAFFIIAVFAVLNVESIYNAFYFRVVNTLYTFGIVDLAVGRSDDPRTAVIWPEFFYAMNSIGWASYLAGYDVGLPTDSGHFAIIREAGVIGYFIFLLLAAYSLYCSRFDKRVVAMMVVIFVGMIFHPIHQGYKTVFLVVISIAYCIVSSRKKVSLA